MENLELGRYITFDVDNIFAVTGEFAVYYTDGHTNELVKYNPFIDKYKPFVKLGTNIITIVGNRRYETLVE